jgi:hypothetical protein
MLAHFRLRDVNDHGTVAAKAIPNGRLKAPGRIAGFRRSGLGRLRQSRAGARETQRDPRLERQDEKVAA